MNYLKTKPRSVVYHLVYTCRNSSLVADGEVPAASGDVTSEEEEEHIVVLRPEEQLDPEVEAEFDKEFERMMVESLDSRKFERKTHFDVPLPLRKAQLHPVETFDDGTGSGSGTETPPNTMAFSLMTKKGNRQQVRYKRSIVNVVLILTS